MWLLTKTQHGDPIQQSPTYCPFDDGEVIVYVGLNMLMIQRLLLSEYYITIKSTIQQ